jgi:translocation and assembly module TamB
MSRRRKIGLIVGGSAVGLLLLLAVTAILILQSAWFANRVREKIIASVEEATGGKVELRSFAFDWMHLRADLRGFVLHGLEPAGAAPLLTVEDVQVGLKLTSPFTGFVNIASLLVDTPRANVMVFANGRTNIPAPKKPAQKNGLQTVVDLAIGRFDLVNGEAMFASKPARIDATGRNLRAHLTYNRVSDRYAGEVDIDPLLWRSGKQAPLAVQVKLPLWLERDRVILSNAQFATARSKVVLSGEVDHIDHPHTSAHVNAEVALDELRRVADLSLPLDLRHGPQLLRADVTGSMDEQRIDLASARVSLGGSNLEAKGTLRNPKAPGNVQFRAALALGEIGRLLKLAQQPEGTLRAAGSAEIESIQAYRIKAKAEGRGLSLREGTTRLAGIDLDTAVRVEPRRIELSDLHLAALGGSFAGSVGIEDLRTFQIAGGVRNFDIARLAETFLGRQLGYDGVLSGPLRAEGDLKHMSALTARADLAIAPAGRGIPVSGKLNVDYNGRADTVTLGQSYVALPHSRLDLHGALGRQIDVRLVSRDFGDFRPLGRIPVTLNRGTATVNATVTGSLSAPRIRAHAALSNFAVEGRPFTSFTGDVAASKDAAAVSNAVLARGALQAQFSGNVGMHNWRVESRSPLRVDATMRNADLADALALAGLASVPATGAFTADAHIGGTIGSPTGSADVTVRSGTLAGEPFDSLTASATMTPGEIDVPAFALVAGAARIDASAQYQHAVNDLETGSLRAHVASSQVQLAQVRTLVKDRPGLAGVLSLNADATANIRPSNAATEIEITSAGGNFNVRGLQMEGRSLGDLSATASTAGNTVQYNVSSNFAGSTIRVNGNTVLAGDHVTTANASIANLPIDRVLAMAGERSIPVTGTLSATGQVSGSLRDPHATASFTVVKGAAWQQAFDRLQADVTYSSTSVEVPNFKVTEGPAYLTASGSFTHPAGDFEDGQVRFEAKSTPFPLQQIQAFRQARQGVAGTAQLSANGEATLRKGQPPLIARLDADLNARGLTVAGRTLGDLTATARTHGQTVDLGLTSNLDHAGLKGTGQLQLTGDFPLTADLTFTHLTYSGVAPLLGWQSQPFEVAAEGTATVTGSLKRAEALHGTVRLTSLEARSAPAAGGPKPRVSFELRNVGPVVLTADRSVVTIQAAHLKGPLVDLTVTGTASLTGNKELRVRADGTLKMELLEALNPDIDAAGAITLTAAVTGTIDRPALNGRVELRDASLNLASVPNGLAAANGVITFNGTQAVIQGITGESGGGKITLGGVVSYGGPEALVRLNATAEHVRVPYPDSISTEVSAKLSLTGTTSRSLLAGNVTVTDVVLFARSDIGSMLTLAATPPPVPPPSTGFLAGMRLDVRIQTAPGVQFRTTLTQNLQADANLTLRGTPDHPGMLGRITVTEGDILFFGSKYKIDTGTISFYDPNRINPYLNVNLKTKVQGIDVSLSVTGPMDRMKLAYHSDPPMQFSDLVALLASGRAPTSDPILAARMPTTSTQTFEQAGASALFGAAVASPVAGRLQRLFGVTRFSINPQLVGTSNSAMASMMLQQQVTPDITFTYIHDATQPNPQIVRVEWSIDPQWSAVAQRDNYGYFDLDFFWKKRFH